tara:strand:+ start:659 stop:1705 length:1047 start_codon:yes stop_codon:yes gene_type:complete
MILNNNRNFLVNNIIFNQNFDLILISTNVGFIIYTTSPFTKLRQQIFGFNVNLIESYFNTNLIFLTGDFLDNCDNYNKIIIIYDDHLQKIIGKILNNKYIFNIKVNKKYIVFCDEDTIYTYNFKDLKFINKYNYFKNDLNINFSLSVYCNNYLIMLVDINKLCIINLDNNSTKILTTKDKKMIQFFILSKDGKYLATTSSGHKIQIFDVINTILVRILKRGTMSCNIKSIYFSIRNDKIIVTSDLSTIHIFINEKEYNYKINKSILNKISKYFDYDFFNYDFSYNRINLNNSNKIACLLSNDKFIIFEISSNPNCIFHQGSLVDENTNIECNNVIQLSDLIYIDPNNN